MEEFHFSLETHYVMIETTMNTVIMMVEIAVVILLSQLVLVTNAFVMALQQHQQKVRQKMI